ncbi:hypothetical protein MANES_07G028850v8 [Manihot esculenta]|uniref:Uncharacterized protein n=1 Tax=Manihot esculenta TaxID=3983 RepID=A0ACB7HDU2_MANES|nr:hypothetical protein MANES_07G028850v8 [Manihot esculenta]
METGLPSLEISFTTIAPHVFDGENYHVWAIRMEAYLDANDLWEAIEEVKSHKEQKARKCKAKACLFAAVNFLKEEYEGNEKIKGMQVMNLVREFEMQNETIKEYSDRLLNIVNKVRLLGTEFTDTRIATISSLEDAKDLSKISLTELIHALQALERRRLMRSEGSVKETKGKKNKKNKKDNSCSDSPRINGESKHDFPPCKHCGKKGHPPFNCWKRPDQRREKCQKTGHH